MLQLAASLILIFPAWAQVQAMGATPASDSRDIVVLGILVLQGLFGVFIVVLGFSVRRVLRDIEDNTEKTEEVAEKFNRLNLSLTTNFVMKEDWVYIRQRVHDLADAITTMKAREQLMRELSDAGQLIERRG